MKKHINAGRSETSYMGEQVKTPNYRSINQVLIHIKKTSRLNTFRSTADV